MSKYKHLEEVSKTIAQDLKCDLKTARGHAMKGVAQIARALGFKLSDKPKAEELDKLLQQHWQKFEEAAKSGPPPKATPVVKMRSDGFERKK